VGHFYLQTTGPSKIVNNWYVTWAEPLHDAPNPHNVTGPAPLRRAHA
jgi:hypothetical protein